MNLARLLLQRGCRFLVDGLLGYPLDTSLAEEDIMNSNPSPRDSAPALPVTHEESGNKGRYVVRLEGTEAEMTYTRAGQHLIIIDHTSVPDALRGRRLGAILVYRAVEDARAAGKSIIPLCPFAKSQFDRHSDWSDVLKQ
jgi:predicted GNAT family acetyltransferase